MVDNNSWRRIVERVNTVERRLRSVVRWLYAAGRSLRSLYRLIARRIGLSSVDIHTLVTFRAVTDAVVPETPDLGDELGGEHVPGGLAINLDDYVITYVNSGFQLGRSDVYPHGFGLPDTRPEGEFPLAVIISHILDAAALKLLDRNENVSEPSMDRPLSLLEPGDALPDQVKDEAGMFSKLSRRDRLRAISILDEIEIELTPSMDELFEFDLGLVGQLVVGFTEIIYYSEWQGYDEFTQPPSKREHPNVPSAVQSWRQTDFPGFANGYAALRGYVGTDEGTLGDGEIWKTITEDVTSPVRISHEPGQFQENDYDTGDYEEIYPE